jgi:hypothetical protein
MRSRTLGALGLFLALHVAGVAAETTESLLLRIESEHDRDDRDTCDLVLSLWDSEAGGHRVSEPITIPGSKLSDLREELKVDFGEDALSDRDLWLEVTARCRGNEEIRLSPGRSSLRGATLSSHP